MKQLFQPIASPLQPLSFPDSLRILESHEDWIVQEAPASPWYWWLSSLSFIRGLTLAGYSPGPFFTTVTSKQIGTLVVEHGTFMRAAKRLVESEWRGQSVVGRWIKEWRAIDRRYQRLVAKIRQTGLKDYNNEALAALFSQFSQIYYQVETLPLSNEFLIPYTDNLLKNEMAKHPDNAAIIGRLITPRQPSFLQIEEEDLRQIAGLPRPSRPRALKAHLQRWFFMGAGYDGPHVTTLAQLERRLRHVEPITTVKKNLAVKINLSKKTKTVIKLTRQVAEWKDERKRNNLIGACILDDFAREFVRRYQIPYRLIRYAVPRDFARIVQRDPKLKAELVNRAESGVAWGISGEKHSDFFTNATYKKIQTILASVKQGTDVVSGVVAYPGMVTGRIRVIHHPQRDLFKAGEILLTSMTRPEFVPLMKKARAILCDEGGLLSHAAIIARELKIPCLVGLKNAMASFQSGDKVLVNANEGWTRKM